VPFVRRFKRRVDAVAPADELMQTKGEERETPSPGPSRMTGHENGPRLICACAAIDACFSTQLGSCIGNRARRPSLQTTFLVGHASEGSFDPAD
jgi:hypothetical protein